MERKSFWTGSIHELKKSIEAQPSARRKDSARQRQRRRLGQRKLRTVDLNRKNRILHKVTIHIFTGGV
jgi:hypothetical protein